MNEQLFFEPGLENKQKEIWLNEEESAHLLRVLRGRKGDPVSLMNGNGLIARGKVHDSDQKRALVHITDTLHYPEPAVFTHLAVCPLKKRDKLEWIVEKATEIGVREISLVQSYHSERTIVNLERLRKIIISSAKQAINPYLPAINPVVNFNAFIDRFRDNPLQKFIAWCGSGAEDNLLKSSKASSSSLVMIGPEGDFSEEEVRYASGRNFVPVSLGKLRLRSETAAVYVVSVLHAKREITNEN